MAKIELTVASLRFNVYETHVSKPTTRLDFVSRCVRRICADHYVGQPGHYLLVTGPEYLFARKNYTLSHFNTPEFKGLHSRKAPALKVVDGEQVLQATDDDMEEGLDARRKTAYSEAEKDTILRELKALSANRPRMLLAPGTILWREYLYFKKLTQRLSPVYNTAPLLCNGAVVHLYDKHRDSDEIKADYRLRGTAHGDQAERYRFVPGNSACRFAWRRLQLGIEICADHVNAELKTEVGASDKVDLHLMWSAGMEPMKKSVGARAGGLMISNDGSKGDRSQQVNQVLDTGLLKPLDPASKDEDWWLWKTSITL